MSEERKYTTEELKEVEDALEVVSAFAKNYWLPCLRDCCGDAFYKVEELQEQAEEPKS